MNVFNGANWVFRLLVSLQMKIVVIIFTTSLFVCIHVRMQLVLIKVGFLEGPVRVNLRVWLFLRLRGNRKQLSCIICITFFYFERYRLIWRPKE